MNFTGLWKYRSCLACPTRSHFIQDEFEISIYLFLDKFKESQYNFVFLNSIIMNSHVVEKMVWILISWLRDLHRFSIECISGFIPVLKDFLHVYYLSTLSA